MCSDRASVDAAGDRGYAIGMGEDDTRLAEAIAAIAAAPDDDAPRLVYADWRQQLGDAHGEFVTLQCALARRDASDPDARRRCVRRERALYVAHRRRWVAELGVHSWLGLAADFRRGFVERLVLSAELFAADGRALFARTPLRELRLQAPDPRALAAILEMAELARLDALQIGWGGDHPVRDEDAEAIARCPHLGGLRSLALLDTRIGPVGARALAASTTLTRLRRLDLRQAPLGDAGLRAFLDHRLPALEELHVTFAEPTDTITGPLGRRVRLWVNGRLETA